MGRGCPPRGGVGRGRAALPAAPAVAAVAGDGTARTLRCRPPPQPPARATAWSRSRPGCERRSRGHYCTASSAGSSSPRSVAAGSLSSPLGGGVRPLPGVLLTSRYRGGDGLGGVLLPEARAEASARALGQIAARASSPCILPFSGASLAAAFSFPASPCSVSGSSQRGGQALPLGLLKPSAAESKLF